MAAAASLIPDQSFQLVSAAHAATPGAEPSIQFRFAYISDAHLYAKGMTHRFAKALVKAVDDINALDPQPDFVLFGGDLAQLGRADERLRRDARVPARGREATGHVGRAGEAAPWCVRAFATCWR